ncbi:MAG: LysE family transporter [Pseudomonadota bacterium]
MTAESLFAFNVALLAAVLSPGPALLVALKTTLSAGRSAGIAVGAGLALVASTWTLMALVGLDVVFRVFPWAYGAAKTLGALYLLYVAVRMWRHARTPIEADTRPIKHAFLQGVLINVLNPKSVLFAAAVLIVVFPADMSVAENAIVVVNHLVVELSFYTAIAIAMSRQAVSRRYLRAKQTLDRFSAIVLGALGLKLLLGRQ